MSFEPNRANLLALTTANPPHIFKQEDVLKSAERIFADRSLALSKLSSIFKNTGIEKRHSARPIEWFDEERGWADRNAAYIETAEALFIEVATSALKQANLDPSQIDTIVTISSTGIATPTIEARAMAKMGFKENTQRVPVFGLGCAGGVTGLSIASRLAASKPDSNLLIVVIELCTLSFMANERTKSNIIATALFGDGAAAAIISGNSKNTLGMFEATGQHTWANTLDIMGWRVEDNGMGAVFDRSIPDLVRERLGDALDGFLNDNNLSRSDLDKFNFHPGGTKVLQALEETFGLGENYLQAERKVLAANGNMSAPTVMFVLKENIAQGLDGRTLISALGPGFSASFITLIS